MTMRLLDIPESLLRHAEELAHEEGISLDAWVASALAQKIDVVETTAQFLKRRNAHTSIGFRHPLDMIPDAASDTGDEPPARWTRH